MLFPGPVLRFRDYLQCMLFPAPRLRFPCHLNGAGSSDSHVSSIPQLVLAPARAPNPMAMHRTARHGPMVVPRATCGELRDAERLREIAARRYVRKTVVIFLAPGPIPAKLMKCQEAQRECVNCFQGVAPITI